MRRFRLLVPLLALGLLFPVMAPAEMVPSRVPRSWGMAPQAQGVTAITDTMPPSNIIVDLIYESPNLWAGTSLGVGVRMMPGSNWTRYGTEDGLGAAEIPALAVLGNGVWAATSHSEVREERSVPWGDGIFILDEMSDQWLERSPVYELPSGSQAEQAGGPFMLCFDIAEFRGGVVGACFAGGLVLSGDAGMTWKTIFRDATAKSDFEAQRFIDLNNRFFSVVVDESAPDSVAIYAGSAYGINKYIFLDSSVKVTGLVFPDLHLDGATLYAATESGLSVTPDRGGSWKTFYGSDGLPSSQVSAVAARGDTIWVGLESVDGSEGMGLAWSSNGGDDWQTINPQPVEAVGPGRRTRDILILGDSVWFACGAGGLLRYNGPEGTFTALLSGRAVNALLPVTGNGSTRLLAGTDDGIVGLPTGAAVDTDLDTIAVGAAADNLSRRVVDLAWQDLPCTTDVAALWAITRDDDTAAGAGDGFATSTDMGETWTVSSRRLPVNDVAFFGCRFYLASDSGLAEGHYLNIDSILFSPTYEVGIALGSISRRTRAVATEIGKNLDGNDSLVALWVGSELGLSRSFDGGLNWGRVFSNPDPLEYDLFQHFRYTGIDSTTEEFTQLSGNFITALALQETGGKPVLWAATQGTGQGRFTNIFTGSSERDGLSFSRDGGVTWSVPLLGHQVWNFAFDGIFEIWAASSQGLLHTADGGITWDTTRSFTDSAGATIDSTVEVLGVAVVEDDFTGNNEIWVGTGNGLLILNRDGTTREIARRTVAGTYSWPLPYSPTFARSRGGLRLHYTALSTGEVTITIYDFANNVVKVLADRAWRDEGVTYSEADVWDGRDEDGRTVAVGTYFFVIEYAGGQTDWGKISIIP